MKCPKCLPLYDHKLVKTGWEDPEYVCKFCRPRSYFDADGNEKDPPKAKEEKTNNIILSEEEWNEYYGGMW